MLVDTVMTAPVVSVKPSASIAEAAKLMLSLRIIGLPVVKSDGTLLGIVSEGDMLRRTELGTERKRPWWLELVVSPGKIAHEYVHSHGRKVEQIMTTDVASIRRNAQLDEIVELMARRHIKRLPVVEDGKVVASSRGPTSCALWQGYCRPALSPRAMTSGSRLPSWPSSASRAGAARGSSGSMSATARWS